MLRLYPRSPELASCLKCARRQATSDMGACTFVYALDQIVGRNPDAWCENGKVSYKVDLLFYCVPCVNNIHNERQQRGGKMPLYNLLRSVTYKGFKIVTRADI
jgi:hypothetical protein